MPYLTLIKFASISGNLNKWNENFLPFGFHLSRFDFSFMKVSFETRLHSIWNRKGFFPPVKPKSFNFSQIFWTVYFLFILYDVIWVILECRKNFWVDSCIHCKNPSVKNVKMKIQHWDQKTPDKTLSPQFRIRTQRWPWTDKILPPPNWS